MASRNGALPSAWMDGQRLATHIKNVPEDEIETRAKAMFAKG